MSQRRLDAGGVESSSREDVPMPGDNDDYSLNNDEDLMRM